jgi:hypothetical protein
VQRLRGGEYFYARLLGAGVAGLMLAGGLLLGTGVGDAGARGNATNRDAAYTVAYPSSPMNTGLPTIFGTATQGQTLTEGHGTWSNSPTSYTYQWQDCDSSGNSCNPISGAIQPTYTLVASDVGDTIRVVEIAGNAAGASSPASSEPTGVVQPASSAGSGGAGGTGGAGSGSTGGAGSGTTGGAGSGSSGSAGPSVAQVEAALAGVLSPSSKLAKIGALLKAGGYTFTFTAPSPGLLVLRWYYVPTGAHIARVKKKQTTLVASSSTSVKAAGRTKVTIKLSSAGRKLLKKSKRLTLTAKDTFKPSGGTAAAAARTFTTKR